jgi:carboxymethylenebutenolidase
MGEMIEYARPDGKNAPAYYAPAHKGGESAPAVVIVQEWWGVTADMMRIADEYAANGFRALVPDLYRGRKAAEGDEATHLMQGLDFQDAFSHDIRGALTHLKKDGAKAGVTGYCMGGALTFLSAMQLKELDAAAVFYGLPPEEAGDPGTIEIPILCHFAKHDEFFSAERAAAIEQRMKEAKVPAQVFWYDAHHAFCNPNPAGSAGLGHYDPQAAHTAWERTVAFFHNALQSG